MSRPLVLVKACLAAALAGGIGGALAWVGFGVFEHVSGTETLADIAYAFLVSSAVSGAFCLAGSILFGLPAHALLTRLRWTGVLPYAAFGTIPGLLLMADMASLGSGTTTYGLLLFGLYDVFMGVAGSLGFWLVARPDRSTSPSPTHRHPRA